MLRSHPVGGNYLDNFAFNGGGMYFAESRSVIWDATIRGNEATNWGGGIYSNKGRKDFARLVVEDNLAVTGGGIWATGFGTLEGVLIDGNTATVQGGGAHFDAIAGFVSQDWVFSGFSALANNDAPLGGGLSLEPGTNVVNAIIVTNTATQGGGVAVVDGAEEAGLLSCLVTGNSADDGGGIYSTADLLTVFEGDYVNNTATYGAGMYVAGGETVVMGSSCRSNDAAISGGCLWDASDSLTWTGGAMRFNTAQNVGGAMVAAGADSTLESVIVRHNSATNSGGIDIATSVTAVTVDFGVGVLNAPIDVAGFGMTPYDFGTSASFTCTYPAGCF